MPSIGIAAPLLVVLSSACCRALRLGGEVGPSTAFLLEAAPPERRGFYVSLQYATQHGGDPGGGAGGIGVGQSADARRR